MSDIDGDDEGERVRSPTGAIKWNAERRDARIMDAVSAIALSTRDTSVGGSVLYSCARAAYWTVADLRRVQAAMNASTLGYHPSARHERCLQNDVYDRAVSDLENLKPHLQDALPLPPACDRAYG